jgi:hypothetical protein
VCDFSKFYESEALIADPVDGPIFASLLGKIDLFICFVVFGFPQSFSQLAYFS